MKKSNTKKKQNRTGEPMCLYMDKTIAAWLRQNKTSKVSISYHVHEAMNAYIEFKELVEPDLRKD